MDPTPQSGRSTRLAMQRLHHSGVGPVKVLLIGDRAHLLSVADGATLAERAADRMWLSTRHGVDLDVLTDLAPVLRAVQGVFHTWRLWRYEAVVVLVGDQLPGFSGRWRTARLSRLADRVLPALADASRVLVVRLRSGAPTASRDSWALPDHGALSSLSVRLGDDGLLERALSDRPTQVEPPATLAEVLDRVIIATQVRFRKAEELKKDEGAIRATTEVVGNARQDQKILTSCPSCLQGLQRYRGDLANGLLEADYIVVEMAKKILGDDWMPEYVAKANAGGIERVLV